MRIISATLLLLASLTLLGCQRGARISKAASVDQPGVGQPDVATAPAIPSGDSKCMEKCRAKADEKFSKCMTASADADACNEAQLEHLLQCNTDCAPL